MKTGLFQPLSLAIGLRYAGSRRSNRFVSFISLFSTFGIAIGVAALMVVFAPNTGMLFAAFTAVGLAASLYHPVGMALLSLGVSPASRGRAAGSRRVAVATTSSTSGGRPGTSEDGRGTS